jgi:Leucine-rich repeat (LRR) protein
MNIQRPRFTVLVFAVILLVFSNVRTFAQSDLELYNEYIDKAQPESIGQMANFERRLSEPDNKHLSLGSDAQKMLEKLIKDKKQSDVLSVGLTPTDTTDLVAVFSLLKHFPNLRALDFRDYGRETKITRKYNLPEEITNLLSLKFLRIYGAQNLNVADTFDKLRRMPQLRGLDIWGYENNVPNNIALPDQITFVKLSRPQLINLNTKNARWRMAKIEQKGDEVSGDEMLLHKLADIKSMEVLDFQFCYLKNGDAFKEFPNLWKLKIMPVIKNDFEFVKSLSALTKLRELAIYQVTDTSQSFSDLGKFQNLEQLELMWIPRFEKHPDELMSIGKLTKLRTLDVQACYMSDCPDFFKMLKNLENVTFKWNVKDWNEKSLFAFPNTLYELPELKSLTIWKTISEITSLKGAAKLQFLDLSANNLKQVPEGITDLKNLITLSLSNNLLKGTLTNRWADLKALENLDLSRNKIFRYPEGVQQLYQLKYLNLATNDIISFPALDNEVYQMKILIVDNNLLDSLPNNIRHYPNLQMLSASNCGLFSVPTDLGLLRQLKELNLERNHLRTLPKGMAGNLSLKNINLKNNKDLEEQSIYDVIFHNSERHFLNANLDGTGLKALPANAPWDKLSLVLDLSHNKLTSLPLQMGKMEWFNIITRENPFPVDTGFIERGITSPGDAKIFLKELGYQTDNIKVNNQQLARSMSEAVKWLSFNNSFEKAVDYARQAEALDPKVYEQNINWYALGIALYKTKDYQKSVVALNKHLLSVIYPKGWSRMAEEIEAALADSYLKLGLKRKAAETYALFASKNENAKSSLNAAISFLELAEPALSKIHFEAAVVQSKADYLEYHQGGDLYNYAEILIMAGKAEEVLKLFQTEGPKIRDDIPPYKDYLETAALLIVKPEDYRKLRIDYLNKIAKNGKVQDWNYDTFNRWVKATRLPHQLKQHLLELEALSR